MANKEVVDWFKSQLKEGFTRAELINTLQESGYSPDYINEIIDEVEGRQKPPQIQPMTPAKPQKELWEPVKWKKNRREEPQPEPQKKTPRKKRPNLKEMAEKPKKKLPVKTIAMVGGILAVIVLIVIAVMFLPGLLSGPSGGCYSPEENSQNAISQSTTLCTGTYEGVAIGINGDDIILDCNGSTLDAGGSRQTTGILVSGKKNIEIKNCNIEGYSSYGINVAGGSEDVVVTDNTFRDNDLAIAIIDSTKCLVKNNQIQGTKGISLDGSSEQNIVSDNEGPVTDIGINLDAGAHKNLISGNTFNSGIHGLLVSSRYNVIQDNEFCENQQYNLYCNQQKQYGTGNIAFKQSGRDDCKGLGQEPC